MIKISCNKRIPFIVGFVLALAGGQITTAGGSSIGICYGLEADNLPSPKEVVSLYKSHHIERMRLYEPNHKVLQNLQGSGIEVLLGIKNSEIKHLATSSSSAENWVKENIEPFWPHVQFKYIAVGNEAIQESVAEHVLPAMLNLNKALEKASLSRHIRISTVVSSSVMRRIRKPSTAMFSSASLKYMTDIGQFLNDNNAPLLANIHPFFNHIINQPFDTSMRYALFLPSETVLKDGKFEYHNSFDIMIDALYVSLRKAIVHNVSIVISETGWPSAGLTDAATPHLAAIYYENVIHHALSSRGTPRHPGRIETYLYSLFNENKKSLASNKRYWGLFYPNMKPLYPISFD